MSDNSTWLMLQDKPLLRFDITKREFDVRNADLLPIRLKGFFPGNGLYKLQDMGDISKYDNYRDAIIDYLSNRVLNLDRANAKKILNYFNFSQSQDPATKFKIAIACKSVSMTDDYWINKGDLSLKWENMNPRKNHLNEIVAHIALTGSSLTVTGLPHTPELTGQGAYAKAWVREEDGMYLYKAGTKGNSEEKVEIIVSNLLDCFDIPHVSYKQASYDNFELHQQMSVSKCKDMADDERCIVTAEDFYSYCCRTDKDFNQEVLNLDSENFYKTCVVDYLISNSDRHLQNWGMYQDNKTGAFLSLHPLFDHNNAFDKYDMEDRDGGKSLMMQGKTKREAALYAIKKCHIHCIKPITKDMFLNTAQYESFMNRACELGLYKKRERNFFSKIRKEEEYIPVRIDQPMIFAEKEVYYPNQEEENLFDSALAKANNEEIANWQKKRYPNRDDIEH